MPYVNVEQRAYFSAGETRLAYRRKGVATAFIRDAERLAKATGCVQIRLKVGSTDNPDAKRLYEHLGYVDWGHGGSLISWDYIDRNGNTGTESEIVTFLYKAL